MSLDRIYYEVCRMMPDEYYAELAQKDVMLIPVLIDSLYNNTIINFRAQSILDTIGEISPELIYPYFDYLTEIMDKSSGLDSWRMLRLIARTLIYDFKNKWNGVRERYYQSLTSENITEFSIACGCVEDIIKAYPSEKADIIKILEAVGSRSFTNEGVKAEALRQVSTEKAAETLAIISAAESEVKPRC